MTTPTNLLLGTVIAAALVQPAVADTKEAVQAHLTTAYNAYKEKRWQDVLDALEKAFALDPKPELYYSMGQVYVKMERCAEAVAAYEKYLASKPPKNNANVAREAIAACKQEPKPEPKPERRSEPPPVEQPRGWDKRGIALVVGGGAVVLTGVAFYVLARSNLSDAEVAPTYREQESLYDSARTKRWISIALVVAGGAITGVGIVHHVRKKPREQSKIGLVPLRDGGFVTFGTGF